MKEKILKWLNTEIIYPISDSQWVNLVHIVSKKARVTVTTNEKGEEIQTRLPIKWRVTTIGRWTPQRRRTTSLSHSSTKSWTDCQDRVTSAFWADIHATTRSPFITTTKRRRHSHVLLTHSPLDSCHLDYATPPRPFKDA